jgi:hypothetical protein
MEARGRDAGQMEGRCSTNKYDNMQKAVTNGGGEQRNRRREERERMIQQRDCGWRDGDGGWLMIDRHEDINPSC